MPQSFPEKLGKYEILGLIGRGSMGVVYKAQDPEIGRTVALKMMSGVRTPNSVGGTSARTLALYSEARSAGSLRHQNIITVFDISVDENNPYIVMDFVEGIGLDRLIKDKGNLVPELALCYLAQAASGLDYAHSRSIVHCDVKPSNLLIDSLDHLFILDFGIAKLITSESSNPNDQVIGTPAYMSPEQINGDKITSKTDIFSLAIVTFESLTGIRPYKGKEFSVVLGNILNGERQSIVDLNPNLPVTLEVIFDKAFDSDPRNRFKDCRSFIEAIADALGLENPFFKLGSLPAKKKLGLFQLKNIIEKAKLLAKTGSQDFKGLVEDKSKFFTVSNNSRLRLIILSILTTTISLTLLFTYIALKRRVNEMSSFAEPTTIPSNFELNSPELNSLVEEFEELDLTTLIEIVREDHFESAQRFYMAIKELKNRSKLELAIFLPKILSHPSQRIKIEGINYLMQIGGINSYNQLVVNLLNDSNALVRLEAIKFIDTVIDKNLIFDIGLKGFRFKEKDLKFRIKKILAKQVANANS
jgi:serine/threonine protein kinase